MSFEYEYFADYNPDCGGEVDLDAHIRSWLKVASLMIDFISTKRPEILDNYLERVTNKIRDDIVGGSYVLSDAGLETVKDDDSILGDYDALKGLSLQLVMKYIPFGEEYTLSSEKVNIRWFDFCQARYMLRYHFVSSLAEILGRDTAIDLYKEFVEEWGKELAKKGKQPISFEEGREKWVKGWASGGMEFGVVDLDEYMYLCKFDKCVSHESMKHVEDQELAHYVVCYPAPKIQKYTLENVRLRRSVTLFIGDFCDELRWDPHVHEEPEQPSHEFSRKIVSK